MSRKSSTAFRSGVSVALAATTLLGLAACSDPGASAAGSANPATPSSSSTGVKTFNLSPQQDRVKATVDKAAAALVPDAIKKDGKLTVAVSPFAAPLAVYATDNKTPVGNEVDLAVALAESLGLEADIVPTAWADWPLGVDSGKYEAVISNVTVTEERKLKFDFASYREDKLGFYAKADSAIGKVETAADVAGKRVIVGSGTNQEAILLRWDEENKKNGLKPVEFQYYDDDSASQLALQSGRADLTFGPNATAAFKAASDAKTKLVGLVDGGWPLKANIAVTSKKDNGFAAAAAAGLNHLIEDGSYAKILDRWGLGDEAVKKSEVNPAGLPKT
ncbi:transporter substrate-binding domain-containing protein [Arthrobacter sp. PAMC25564]|uniref:ABC transporter substrate-binding protein n=1 Tax=Arthrobacter sp. PAMC25564 TaxID=2565366 RepID=UPI0010A29CEE|nr:ABC transporter substrate-binding protein [Arthrobacter sp. PAMC25564]QCB95949.1 transporter substrate-binding domain-containing protein [Arthrobacter sp. PAMC25564]